ncbi:MAG: TetR/AcrR family transcriptional regulator [Proteobacteria bacterium]|nr:TetR/AcrR family transcriptional regulator [Pseudomonadota bacterium]
MRHPNLQRQSDRRAEILDAAERCFARAGFHRASMQDICTEAVMSPGNLYRYFPSKEALIAGICERNRADAVDSFNHVQEAPDFFQALAGLARYHLVDRTDEEVSICAEIMAESRRHPDIRQLYQTIENDIRDRLAGMLQDAAQRGEIRTDLDPQAVAGLLMAIGDGMSWRRSVDPKFNAEESLPLILNMVHGLLALPRTDASGDGARS